MNGLRADRLRTLRESRNYSQREFAKLCGVSSTLIRSYEKGEADATAEKLVAIADIFNVSIDYLTGRTDDPGAHVAAKELSDNELLMLNTFRREGWFGIARLGVERLHEAAK